MKRIEHECVVQCVAAVSYSVLQCVTVCCSVLQCVVVCCSLCRGMARGATCTHTATHCNTMQYIVTHCNTLQHTATHCNNSWDRASIYGWQCVVACYCSVLKCVAVCCSVYTHNIADQPQPGLWYNVLQRVAMWLQSCIAVSVAHKLVSVFNFQKK